MEGLLLNQTAFAPAIRLRKPLGAASMIFALMVTLAPVAVAQNHLQVTDGAGPPGGDVTLSVEMTNDFDILGWSFGLCIDTAVLTASSAGISPDIAALNPEFNDSQVTADGVGLGLVLSFDPLQTIAPQAGLSVFEATFTLDGPDGTVTSVTVCDTIGTPPIDIIFGGPVITEVEPTSTPGTITIEMIVVIEPEFRRGDCNSDATFNIADGIILLEALFAGGIQPTCDLACDTNDDETINIADAIFVLDVLFGGMGAIIPEPAAGCGTDPTTGSLTCVMGPCP